MASPTTIYLEGMSMRLRVNSRLLNEAMARLGLSVWQLSVKLGMSSRTVQKVLNSDMKIQPRTAKKLIAVFGQDVVYVDNANECTVEGDEE